MLKTLTGIAAAATIAVAGMVAAPQQAEAHCYGCAVGAGVVGGLAAGAIIGSALAGPRYYGPGYYGYYGPAPVYYGPRCWWSRRWTPYGWRSVRVCR